MSPEEHALEVTKVVRKLARGLRVNLKELAEVLGVGVNWFSQRVERGTIELVDLYRILAILEVPPHLFFALVDPTQESALKGRERARLAEYQELVDSAKVPGVRE